MEQKLTCLTGIKPTGLPHWGNYFAAIKPALIYQQKYICNFFIPDYHALTGVKNPSKLKREVFEVAATWLAAGLDAEKTCFYRQSAIHAIPQLTIVLMNYTAKGLMNRAHAYKATVADNIENNADPDRRINMGLFNYPTMMAADILMFQAHLVPIGRDQLQHLEITNDIAEAFNSQTSSGFFTLPKPLTGATTQVLIGTDGRKMSKSYGNTIPLFAEPNEMFKLIKKIPTTSQSIEEPKDPETCNVFSLFKLFATNEECSTMHKKYTSGGLGWGEAKSALYEVSLRALTPLRERYTEIIKDLDTLEKILKTGEEKANAVANRNIAEVKKIVGLL